tara:strand:- start:155 stop:904 length:750 start_codon:yes stop_codon:yes gene_type:complete
MANELEEKLLKELSRFNQITHNTDNLNEQMVSGLGNLGMGSHVERLAKRVGLEMGEQESPEAEEEIPLDPEAEIEDLDVEEGGEEGSEEGGEEITDVEIDDTMDLGGEESTEGTTELEVTDLVTKQDETNTELSDQKDILAKNTESLDDLMSKLSDLETHLTSMDDMVNKISSLEDKLEEYRPKTEEEKLGLRKYDSGPFNKTLSDFFSDKEEVFDKTGKKEYILKPEDVIDYNESDIKKSFDPDSEDE